jgi:parallel beta-helix repeat protein
MKRIIVVLFLAVGCQLSALGQEQPGIAITILPYSIVTSGVYYVTNNITCTACGAGKNGITITDVTLPNGSFSTTENVTVNLNGFTLFGVPGSGSGIAAGPGHHNIVICDGTLRNWGVDGVDAASTTNSRFESLQFYANHSIGLEAGLGSVVVNCEATGNSAGGYSLQSGDISHCVAVNNGFGILASNGCVVADCAAQNNFQAGIRCFDGCLVKSCTTFASGGSGIQAVNNCLVIDCAASASSRDGIQAQSYCAIKDCIASRNSEMGISGSAACTIKDCIANQNRKDGIWANNGCVIADNTCGSNIVYGIEIAGVQNRIDNNSVVAHLKSDGIYLDPAALSNLFVHNWSPGLTGYGYPSFYYGSVLTFFGSPSPYPWANFQ